MKKLFVLFFLAAVYTISCTTANTNETQELRVFAAASLTDAFNELAHTFEAQHENVRITANYAGSSQLATQIIEGANADLFASANPLQMERVIADGRIAADATWVFASNRLTIIVPADNPAGIHTLEDLAQPNTQLILAVPAVPIRQYTDQAIATLPAQLQQQIYNNVVSEEDNVRQVSAKIALGEADAGIVYTSDVTPDIANQIEQIPISASQNISATYPIAPLTDAPNPELAQAFINFVLSPEGQSILSGWGFAPPPDQ